MIKFISLCLCLRYHYSAHGGINATLGTGVRLPALKGIKYLSVHSSGVRSAAVDRGRGSRKCRKRSARSPKATLRGFSLAEATLKGRATALVPQHVKTISQ